MMMMIDSRIFSLQTFFTLLSSEWQSRDDVLGLHSHSLEKMVLKLSPCATSQFLRHTITVNAWIVERETIGPLQARRLSLFHKAYKNTDNNEDTLALKLRVYFCT
jgi:hypothetical protein